MTQSFSSNSQKHGLPPGSLIHVGESFKLPTHISIVDYKTNYIKQRQIQDINELLKYKDTDTVTWVTIEGLKDVDAIAEIGSMLGIHDLVLEDILNTNQRPKFEEYDDHLYIVLKCLLLEGNQFTVQYEQVSLLVLKNFVFLFKEKQDTLFDSIQHRISAGKGKLNNLGTDYLTYTILDTIIDQGFLVIDALDDAISELEDSLLNNEPTQEALHTIQRLRREIIRIRRHVSPVRDLLSGLLRCESDLIDEKTHIYLKDAYDHTLRVVESIEAYREILTGLLDIYISSVSNKMNEVMKVLTVFASIFIPLTFLAGIYGMNFDYMPELKWKWAYPTLWAAFIVIPVTLLIYFKKKKWF